VYRNGYCLLNCSIRRDSPTDVIPIVEVIYHLSECEIDLVSTGTCYKSTIKSPLHSLDTQITETGESCSFTDSDIGVSNYCYCCMNYVMSISIVFIIELNH
jgi:hypothetical protein